MLFWQEIILVSEKKVPSDFFFFLFFERSLFCAPRLHVFDQKYSKNGNIVNYYYYIL